MCGQNSGSHAWWDLDADCSSRPEAEFETFGRKPQPDESDSAIGVFFVNGDCITFVGDLYAPEAFRSRLPLTPPWVGNLESPVTRARIGTTGKINLKAEALYFEESIGSLPAAVSLANNHILDYGDTGLLDTLQVLGSAGVQAFGFPTARGIPATHAHISCAGLDVVLLGYVCPSTHPVRGAEYSPMLIEDELIKSDIRLEKRKGADRVVLCLHWGQDNAPLPTPRDRLRAHEYAEAGADLIIGHHSHRIQAWELIGNCPVFYGLGNFFFPDPIRAPTEFDKDGSPLHWFEIRWHSWNRTSLLIEWSPASRRWRARTTVFRGSLLGFGGADPRRWKLRAPHGDAYARMYEASVRASSLKVACRSFLARPRIPPWAGLAFAAKTILGRNARSEGKH